MLCMPSILQRSLCRIDCGYDNTILDKPINLWKKLWGADQKVVSLNTDNEKLSMLSP